MDIEFIGKVEVWEAGVNLGYIEADDADEFGFYPAGENHLSSEALTAISEKLDELNEIHKKGEGE